MYSNTPSGLSGLNEISMLNLKYTSSGGNSMKLSGAWLKYGTNPVTTTVVNVSTESCPLFALHEYVPDASSSTSFKYNVF